jgi:hypothetical protein
LQRAFDTLTVEVNAMINQAQLAAQNLTHLREGSFVKQGCQGFVQAGKRCTLSRDMR